MEKRTAIERKRKATRELDTLIKQLHLKLWRKIIIKKMTPYERKELTRSLRLFINSIV